MKKDIYLSINKTLILMTLLFGSTAWLKAQDQKILHGDISYTITSKSPATVKISDYNCFEGAANIPATIIHNDTTYTVTSIGDFAFSECEGLTSIAIPNSVTSIGAYAFNGCINLQSIDIPNSVTTLESSIFYGCSELKSATLSNALTSISNELFYGCYNLGSITIPNNVTSIGESAFFYCSSITSIIIPNGVTTIGSSAFAGTGISSIIIPELVTNLYDGIFYNCTNLSSITLPETIKSIGNSTFLNCNISSIDIPDSVIAIHHNAFMGCGNLTYVNIPSSVTYIGSYVFYNCARLDTVHVNWKTPFTVNPNIFIGVDLSKADLIVPIGTINNYDTTAVWKEFGIIKEEGIVTSTYKEQVTNTLNIYPMPASDFIYLEIEEPIATIQILDSKGILLKTIPFNTNKARIETSDLNSGAYFFKVTTNQHSFAQQVIIK